MNEFSIRGGGQAFPLDAFHFDSPTDPLGGRGPRAELDMSQVALLVEAGKVKTCDLPLPMRNFLASLDASSLSGMGEQLNSDIYTMLAVSFKFMADMKKIAQESQAASLLERQKANEMEVKTDLEVADQAREATYTQCACSIAEGAVGAGLAVGQAGASAKSVHVGKKATTMADSIESGGPLQATKEIKELKAAEPPKSAELPAAKADAAPAADDGNAPFKMDENGRRRIDREKFGGEVPQSVIREQGADAAEPMAKSRFDQHADAADAGTKSRDDQDLGVTKGDVQKLQREEKRLDNLANSLQSAQQPLRSLELGQMATVESEHQKAELAADAKEFGFAEQAAASAQSGSEQLVAAANTAIAAIQQAFRDVTEKDDAAIAKMINNIS